MGLLDDAIREHLELKRRAGADPTEVARLEREAFGAQEQERAENGGVPGAPPGVADQLQPDPGRHVDLSDAPHPDEHVHEPAAAGDALVSPEPDAHDSAAAVEASAQPPLPEPAAPAVEPHLPAGERHPAPAEPPPPAPEREPVEQPTRQFTAAELEDAQRPPRPEEDRPAPADDDDPRDELEDTPDFLQETPEHDRLWFEQKPPRDFDF